MYEITVNVAISLIIIKLIAPLVLLLLNYSIGKLFFSRRKELKVDNGWVIITGATDGVGKAFAYALAHDKLNLVLISRTQSKLDAVSKDIKDKHNVEIETVSADFTKDNIYESIASQLEDKNYVCLINNVGMSYEYPDFYESDSVSPQFINNIVNCNILSMAQMSKIFMSKSKKSQSKFIMNIGSISGMHTMPLLTLYGATKAFTKSFSEALNAEYDGQSVWCQSYMPHLITTKLSDVRKTSLFIPTPEVYAESALDMLGVVTCGQGFIWHEVMNLLFNLLPSWMVSKIIKNTLSGLRKRALRKKEKAK